MFLFENITLALAGLKANKMRALLTMLGIIIGIGSVIAIVSIGGALTNSVMGEMQGMGATNIYVVVQEKGETSMGGMQTSLPAEPTDEDLITDQQIEDFENHYADRLKGISIDVATGKAKAQEGHLYANVNMTGTNVGYGEVNNVKMIQGRYLRESDIKGAKNVAIVSDKFVKNLFASNVEPLGREVKIYVGSSITTFTIIGVYKHEATAFSFGSSSAEKDTPTNFYYPVTVAKQDQKSKNNRMITVMPKEGENVEALTKELKKYFSKLYIANPKWDVMVMNMESQLAMLTTMLTTISTAISAIAAISLLVGGIGVMNIMLVSVTERTREIGTRKALGAKGSHIRIQFIVESVIICAIGGIIGVIVGLILGTFGAGLLGYPSTISFPIIVISVTFSMIIGIFFGYYPANKAAKLDPIEALRYE